MRKRSLEKKYSAIGWYFIITAVVSLLIFMVYPFISSFILSFKTGKGLIYSFNGLGNIKRLVGDRVFLHALRNNLIFLIVQVPLMTVLGVIIANILNDDKLRFRGLFRTAIFIPCVTSLVAYSVVFKSMFGYDGIINRVIMILNLTESPIDWFNQAFFARLMVIIAITWRWTGYNAIFYLAGMQNIDPSIYEAARIDGANGVKRFLRITVPMLKPIILFTTIMSTIGTLQLFDEVINLTNGGPNNATITLSQYIYDLSFVYVPNFGYAATISYVIVTFVALLSILQFKVGGKKNV